MGGAQPLAATLAGACSLNIECQQSRIDFRLRSRYLDEQAADLDDALARIDATPPKARRCRSACWAMPPRSCPSWPTRCPGARHPARPGHRPDLAHDPINGYLPPGWTRRAQWASRAADPEHAALQAAAAQSLRRACAGDARFPGHGRPDLDYGNNIRQVARTRV
jgi:urocanate hydratase